MVGTNRKEGAIVDLTKEQIAVLARFADSLIAAGEDSAEKLAVSGLRSKLETLRAERSKLEAVKQDAIRQADEAIAAKSAEVSALEDEIAKAG